MKEWSLKKWMFEIILTIIIFLIGYFFIGSLLLSQSLNMSMGINKGFGFHDVGIDFFQKHTESLLEFDLNGERFNLGVEFEVYNIKFNYKFENGNYSGFMWDTDYQVNIMTNRIEAWTDSYSNMHLLELGYIFKYKDVNVGLFLSQFWMKLEYTITNGHNFISNGWYVDKPIYGLNSIYTDKNSGCGIGTEIDFWKFKTKFNYFHRVKNSGEGWWNLRNMTWSINDYLDYYRGNIKFIGIDHEFFDVYLNYSFDVFHSISNAHNAGSNSKTIINEDEFKWRNNFNKNTKFYHGIGFGIVLNI